MPILPENKDKYPPNWKQISERIRFERAGNRCEWYRAENYKPHPKTGSKVILTVAHLNYDPTDNREDNLAALCQRCHNRHDASERHKNRVRRLLKCMEASQRRFPFLGDDKGEDHELQKD